MVVPGQHLAAVLATKGMSQAELAVRIGRPQKTINEIVKGKAAITPDTALQLRTMPWHFCEDVECTGG